MRWEDFFEARGKDFFPFWERYLQGAERHVLFIMGEGFDPRMNDCLSKILQAGGGGDRHVLVCPLGGVDAELGDEANRTASEDNRSYLRDCVAARGGEMSVIPRSAGRRASQMAVVRPMSAEIRKKLENGNYTDVIVDVSALPRALYFSLIAVVLDAVSRGRSELNVHVVASHCPSVDRMIRNVSVVEQAEYLSGFSVTLFESESNRDLPTVWLPLLGAGKAVQLERIYQLVQPDEICPVLPSPSQRVREADDILVEHQRFLFDRLRVEAGNVVYAAEDAPFEVYRQVMDAATRYQNSLKPLGGCRVAVSTTSSKLFSLGGLLAAYDLHKSGEVPTAVAHVNSQGYRVERGSQGEEHDSILFTLWLAGRPYG